MESPNALTSPAQATHGSAEPMEHNLAMLERVLEQRPQLSNRQFQKGNRNKVRFYGNTQRLSSYDDLFYVKVLIGGKVEVRAMFHSGSMACTLSSSVLPELLHAIVLRSS